jgi:hypothetical protein
MNEISSIDWTIESKKERNRQKKSFSITADLKSFLLFLAIPIFASISSFYINMIEVLLEQTSEGCFYGDCFLFGWASEVWFVISRLFYSFLATILCANEK